MCIVLSSFSAPLRWNNFENVFCSRFFALSEVLFEELEIFIRNCGTFLKTIRSDLLTERGQIYADENFREGAPLDRCIGFIECTNIEINRNGLHSENQRAVYFGHEIFN